MDILVMEALPRGIGVFFQSELSARINTLNTYRPLCFQKMWTTWHRKTIICICHKLMHFQPFSKAWVHQILLEDGLSDPNCPFLLFLPAQIVIWERITYIYKENNLSETGNCSENPDSTVPICAQLLSHSGSQAKWANIFFTAIFRAIWACLRGKKLLWTCMGKSPCREVEMVALNQTKERFKEGTGLCCVYHLSPSLGWQLIFFQVWINNIFQYCQAYLSTYLYEIWVIHNDFPFSRHGQINGTQWLQIVFSKDCLPFQQTDCQTTNRIVQCSRNNAYLTIAD